MADAVADQQKQLLDAFANTRIVGRPVDELGEQDSVGTAQPSNPLIADVSVRLRRIPAP
jgi:hypothetical protein